MHNQTEWNVAVTQFAAFCSHIPLTPTEDDISEYHGIIKLFEDAYEHDLSQFRIAPDRILQTETETGDSLQGRWQTRQPVPIVEYRYFRGQLRGLVDFLTGVLSSGLC
ncbi:MAG: hypothetical protein WBR26_10295 [Candidatus Acidiferrum sp.]